MRKKEWIIDILIYTFEAKLRNMEHEIGNISIARIRQMNPSLKGINNDFVMDRSEHYIPENMNPIFKYPLGWMESLSLSVKKALPKSISIYGNTTLRKTI